MTMSIVDILDRFFESDQVKTVMSLNGLIGTWAGPYEPGTGYVMAHHSIGDVGDGNLGAWAVPEGGMGAVAAAIESSARTFGAEIRTNARVARILTADGAARGVALEDGRGAARAARRDRDPSEDHVPAAARSERAPGGLRARHRVVEVAQRRREDQLRARPRAGVHRRTPSSRTSSGGVRAGALDRVPRDGVRGGARGTAVDAAVLRRRDAHVARPDRSRRRASTSSRCSRSGCRTSGARSRTATSWRPTPTA